MEQKEPLWFALVLVEPLPGNTRFDASDRGAYVTTVGRAPDERELAAQIETRLLEDSMKLVEIDDVRALTDPPESNETERVKYFASLVSEEEPIVIGDSYSFEDD